jgi:hypothetical protein
VNAYMYGERSPGQWVTSAAILAGMALSASGLGIGRQYDAANDLISCMTSRSSIPDMYNFMMSPTSTGGCRCALSGKLVRWC